MFGRGWFPDFPDADNYLAPFLGKGNFLNSPYRNDKIESHVVHSFNFLSQIPWTPEFRAIPEIARAHHEKPNGKGYPFGLNSGQIPVQAKMMAICDIFDALSASDRPYKRAVPTNRALDILKLCARDEEIDAELLGVFLDAQIYRLGGKSSFKQPTADGVP